MLEEQERRLYDLYADTDRARIAWEKEARRWRGLADALALVLKRNGVGGRQWQSAVDLYDQSSDECGPWPSNNGVKGET